MVLNVRRAGNYGSGTGIAVRAAAAAPARLWTDAPPPQNNTSWQKPGPHSGLHIPPPRPKRKPSSPYPKKTNKEFAKKVFAKLKVDEELLNKILRSLDIQTRTIWKDKDAQYIPHPSTWLNGKRWEDEIAAPPLTAAEKLKRMANGRP
jgi:hypothetical protein